MDAGPKFVDLTSDSFHNTGLSEVYFCAICEKPFGKESSRNRHSSYCRRRVRKRPRSCLACNAAKTKCSFGMPCSRCDKKCIECIYDGSERSKQVALPDAQLMVQTARIMPSSQSEVFTSESLPEQDVPIFGLDSSSTDVSIASVFEPQLTYNTGGTPLEWTSQCLITDNFLTFDHSLAFEDDMQDQNRDSTLAATSIQDKVGQQSAAWCSWIRRDISLMVVTKNYAMLPNSAALDTLQIERPFALRNADIIVQSLRSIPTMMLRKETFPWFIHSNSQLSVRPKGSALPEALSACMSAAQMFVSRTSDTRSFLWRIIKSECRDFVSEMNHMSKPELLAALQACMVYLIMYIMDYSSEDEQNGLELLLAINDLYCLFKRVCGGPACSHDLAKANCNWEDWIFSETQQRLSLLWFLIGCVVCVKNGSMFDESQSYRAMPLPCSKSLWEASNSSIWQSEYELSRISQTSGMTTMGDLLDAQQSSNIPSNARKLDIWNAGIDNLGSLLNLVGTMV